MVLISHDHEFVFLKTRKTAGTSIEMYLQPFCTPAGTPVTEKTRAIESAHGVVGMRLYRADEATPLDDRWFHHIRAARVRRQLGAERWDRYSRLTALRNPFDRMVSLFHWLRGARPAPAGIDALRAAFRRFVLHGRWHDDRVVTHIDDTFVPQHVIRYEHMQGDLARLAALLGLDTARTALPMTKVRARSGPDLPDYYDRDTTRTVRDRLAWMFEHGGYDPLPQPLQPSVTP